MQTLQFLKPYLLRYRKILLIGVVTVILSNIFNVIQPLLLGKAVDELKYGLETHTIITTDLLKLASLIVIFALFAGICIFFTRQTIIVASRHIEYDLRNDFLQHLQSLHYSYFQNTSTGDLMAHATNDINAVRNALGPGIMYPVDTIITLIFVLIMMLIQDRELTLLALIPMIPTAFIVYLLGKAINKKFTERQEQFSLLTSQAHESLLAIRVLRSFAREEYEKLKFNKLSLDYLKKNLQLAVVHSALWAILFVFIGISLSITLYAGGIRVIESRITIGTLTAFATYLAMLIWPMIAFGWVVNMWQQGSASVNRLKSIFDIQPEICDNELTNYNIKDIKGTIEFINVSFTYINSSQPAIKNINLKIHKGETVGIVGQTGSGKTTLVSLIPRIYDATSGRILIDGIEIEKIPLSVLRAHIGFVAQEPFLFSDTIAENIRLGTKDCSYDLLYKAAEIAQILKDVEEFPNQFETIIGERGITLSGGQKQRATIARAIVRNPCILILDDALSAVDTHTANRITKNIRDFMNGKTCIIISHRILTVKDADKIVVLDNGEIAEIGTHDELMSTNGIYANLYRKQLIERQLEKIV